MTLLVHDSTGEPSWTLTLSLIPMGLISIAFVLSRFGVGAEVGVAEYAGAMTLLAGPILARKWVNTQAAKVEAAIEASAKVEAATVEEQHHA